ncbi:MAG TPA: hypothetical protein VGB51_00480 [Actinomycetota bacterium]
MIFELVIAGIFALLGVRSAVVSLGQTEPEDSAPTRLLVALHSAAGAGAWFALSGAFVGGALAHDAAGFRWFAVVAIALAGVRMLVSARLAAHE